MTSFPKTHYLAVGLICVFSGSLGLSDLDAATAPPEIASNIVELALPPDSAAASVREVSEMDIESLEAPETPTIRHKVRSGETLSSVFEQYGFSSNVLYQIVNSGQEGRELRSIRPGKVLSFDTDEDGTLRTFTYNLSPLEALEFRRSDSGFTSELTKRDPEVDTVFRNGRIDQSLFLSAQRSGLTDALIMQLAQIFQWDIDFALDIRRGDEFSVVLEELYLDGKFIGHGDILAAEFVNQGETFRAVRFEDADGGAGYYTPDGKSLRKAFLRAPLEFSRISSNFDPRRIHPLFRRAMPHRGIDYAAPTGTPVRASGSGRVATASKTAANGNYIVLQHGAEYQTKYLHLTRFAKGVRNGTRVRQGDIIGYVGATGWATAPHLHYEFLHNGVHQNPRTVKLPNDAPIDRAQLAAFKANAGPLLLQLDAYRQGPAVASSR